LKMFIINISAILSKLGTESYVPCKINVKMFE
jgi:hypothetical protein